MSNWGGVKAERPRSSAVTAPSVAPFAQNRNLRKRNRRRRSDRRSAARAVASHRRSGGAGGSGCWQQLEAYYLKSSGYLGQLETAVQSTGACQFTDGAKRSCGKRSVDLFA